MALTINPFIKIQEIIGLSSLEKKSPLRIKRIFNFYFTAVPKSVAVVQSSTNTFTKSPFL